MKECGVCGEPVNDPICSYCGFINAKITAEDMKEVVEKAKEKTREDALSNIVEVGIVIWRYRDVQNDKVNCDRESYSLLSSLGLHNGTITGTAKTVNVKNGKDITFYLKTNQNPKEVLIQEKLNVPSTHDTFEISVKMNERLKIDVFYYDNDGSSEGIKTLDNIKLGSTLIGN